MRPRERCVRGGPMRRFFVALRALVYMTGFVLFWGWIALSAREFDRSFGVLLPAWTETSELFSCLWEDCLRSPVLQCSLRAGEELPLPLTLQRSSWQQVLTSTFAIPCTLEHWFCWSALVCTCIRFRFCCCLRLCFFLWTYLSSISRNRT